MCSSPGDWLDGLRRSYSVWDYDDGVLSLCVLDHGDGPGARWARAVRPGQEVLFSRPEGNLVARPPAYHVFAGEETAAVACGAMIRALLAGGPADIRGVIEVGSPADRSAVSWTRPALQWAYRNGRPAAGVGRTDRRDRRAGPARRARRRLRGRRGPHGSGHLPPPGPRSRLAAPGRAHQAVLEPG